MCNLLHGLCCITFSCVCVVHTDTLALGQILRLSHRLAEANQLGVTRARHQAIWTSRAVVGDGAAIRTGWCSRKFCGANNNCNDDDVSYRFNGHEAGLVFPLIVSII